MLLRAQISLNRIIYPHIDLTSFFELISKFEIHMIELRNDLPGSRIIDGMAPERICELTVHYGIKILTINALQKFNLLSHLPQATEELQGLIKLASAIHCPAIVLCPLNDPADTRDQRQRFGETVSCLQAYRQIFADAGIKGYLEPLGFAESSLSSLVAAQAAIRESGAQCYRIVYDTFHHFIGPDHPKLLEAELDVNLIDLVHASGVETKLPKQRYRDEHRGLITVEDKIANLEQIEFLLRRGFDGPVSLEPFASRVQNLSEHEFKTALAGCIDLLLGRAGRVG
jgi:2-keto-myo-inositol isomerase